MTTVQYTIYINCVNHKFWITALPLRATWRGCWNWVGCGKFQRCVPVSVFIIMTRIHPDEHKVRCCRAIFNRNFLHFVNFRPMNWYQFSHRVNNWYQYVTDFIPIFFMCERNMHVVKIHVAIMQIPHIDKVSHKAAAFYIGTHSIVRSRRQLNI